MFIVCEPIAWGMEHAPFNAALLRTICFAFPNDIICFYAEDSHSEHVREQMDEAFAASIVWRKLVPPSRHSRADCAKKPVPCRYFPITWMYP